MLVLTKIISAAQVSKKIKTSRLMSQILARGKQSGPRDSGGWHNPKMPEKFSLLTTQGCMDNNWVNREC